MDIELSRLIIYETFKLLYENFDQRVLELLLLWCTFEHSTKCINLSFDSHSFCRL